MDKSISLVTPEMHYCRGFDAYFRGEPSTSHNMNEGSPAIADWKRGWRAAHWLDLSKLFTAAAGSPP